MKKQQKLNFSPPKYKKGENTKKGVIEHITYDLGINWYFIEDRYYAERELDK
jgi:hypothetical protein